MKRLFVIVLFLLWAPPLHALICAKDLNGDGNLDFASEVATCASVQGKDFCPIGAADCNAASSNPTCPGTGGTLCPSEGMYNASMNRCELPPVVTSWRCPATGSTFENQSSCQNACLQSGTCNGHSHQNGPYYCQTYAGGTANVCDLQYCQINGGGSVPCPPGVNPTYSGSNCPGASLTYWGETYYWGPSDDLGLCFGHWSRVWYYFNTVYHWTCSLTGIEYGDSGACNANCTQESACTALYGCPSGYQMADNVCSAAPITGPAASFNPSSHLCETTPTVSCLSGFSYDGILDLCVRNVYCPPGGAFNSQVELCQAPPTLLCPAGYASNAARGLCDAAPSCPAGSAYSASADRCEAAVISSYQCPTTVMNYSTEAECRNACRQTRTCIQTCPPANLSGSFNFDPAYNFMGGVWPTNNGTCLNFFGRVGQGAGTICASNGVTFGEGYNSSAGSGTHWSTSVVYTQDNKICFTGYCMPIGNAGQYRNYLTVYGASVSGGSNSGTATIVKGWGSGNDLCFQGVEQSCDEWGCGWNYTAPFCITITPNCYQACPLGAYPCVGGTCSSGSACSGPNYSCPSGYSLNGTACVVSPTCPAGGSLNGTTDRCEAGYSPTCPSGYSYNGEREVCEAPPCPPESIYRSDPGACIADMVYQCIIVFTYNSVSRLCEAQPQCVTGNFDPATDLCLGRATECPYGNQYDCLPNPVTGVMQCSPNACFDPVLQPTETKNADLKGLHDDAEVNQATGECRGTIMIFNGKPAECKTAGISTSFFNCCDTDEGSLGPVRERCGDGDATTVQAVGAGRCHHVGDYCKEEWWLIGCVQRANTYCCFNSKLGRIIHEQGRPQLQQFAGNGGWGGAENPNCRGFTPEEFQMLDFSRIDLSEYFGDIRTKATQEIKQNMEGKVREYYQNIR